MWRHIPLTLVLTGLLFISRAYAEKGPTLLVFTAGWCASCREVLPAVKAYASGKGYAVQVVDVDDSAAQGLTRQYGLSMNQVAPPMVYFVTGGKPSVIIDDKSDHSQTADILRQKLK
jgi:thiol:disulfide interchange protein